MNKRKNIQDSKDDQVVNQVYRQNQNKSCMQD